MQGEVLTMPDNENEETQGTEEEETQGTPEEENDNDNEEEEEEEETQSMTAIVRKNLVSQVYEFAPDELISGSELGFGMYDAVLRTQGEYNRGELLMLSENQYIKATSAGVSSADSLVILAENITVGEDEYAEVLVYSSGRFKADKVILPYETASDSHDELIAAIKNKLMQLKIYLD